MSSFKMSAVPSINNSQSSTNGPLILNGDDSNAEFPALASLGDALNAIDHSNSSSNKQKHLYHQQQQGSTLNSSSQVNQQSQTNDGTCVVNSTEANATSASVVKGKGKSAKGRKVWKPLDLPIMPRDPNDKDRDIRGDKATTNSYSKYSKGNKNRSRAHGNSSSNASSSSGVNHGGHHHHGHQAHHPHPPQNSSSSAQSNSSEADAELIRNASRRNGPSNVAGATASTALITGPGANVNVAINSGNGNSVTTANTIGYAAVVGGSNAPINTSGPANLHMPVAVVANAGAPGLVLNQASQASTVQEKSNSYRQANPSRRGGKYSQRPRANSPQRSTGKSEFRRNDVPSNVGLPSSIASGGSVITPNGSGRATPVANGGVPVVEEFPPDIQYYVDFASISDPSITPTAKTAVLSPVIPGVPGAAIVPTPAYALSAPPPAATSNLAPFFPPTTLLSTVAFAPTLAPVSNATVTVTPAAVVPASAVHQYAAALSPPDPEDLKEKIRHQIEYYFSEENLHKDIFIRKKMDSEGYLPISLIASFHRVTSLTQDVAMIISALKDSLTVELSESQLKARPRENPTSWPMSDKPLASNASVDSSPSSLAKSPTPASPSTSVTTTTNTSTVGSGSSNQHQLPQQQQQHQASAGESVATSSSEPLPPSVQAEAQAKTSDATVDNSIANSSANKQPCNKQQDAIVVSGNSELHADVPSFVPGKPYNVTAASTSSSPSSSSSPPSKESIQHKQQ